MNSSLLLIVIYGILLELYPNRVHACPLSLTTPEFTLLHLLYSLHRPVPYNLLFHLSLLHGFFIVVASNDILPFCSLFSRRYKIIILYKFSRRERTICLFVSLLRVTVHFHETNQHCVVLFHWRHHPLSTSIPSLLHSFHSTITTGTPVVPLEHSFKPSSNNSLQTYGLL